MTQSSLKMRKGRPNHVEWSVGNWICLNYVQLHTSRTDNSKSLILVTNHEVKNKLFLLHNWTTYHNLLKPGTGKYLGSSQPTLYYDGGQQNMSGTTTMTFNLLSRLLKIFCSIFYSFFFKRQMLNWLKIINLDDATW